MSSIVKSATYLEKNSQSLREVKEALTQYNQVVEKNTKELQKINKANEDLKTEEKKKLKTALNKLETQIQWVKNEEPAIKVDTEHLLRKLDIL